MWKGYGHLWLSRTSGQFGGGKIYIHSNGLLTLQAKRSGQKPADCPVRPKQLLTDPCKALKDYFFHLFYLLTPSPVHVCLAAPVPENFALPFHVLQTLLAEWSFLSKVSTSSWTSASFGSPVIGKIAALKELSTPFNHSHDLSRTFPHRCFIFIYPGEWSTAETISLFAAVLNTLL